MPLESLVPYLAAACWKNVCHFNERFFSLLHAQNPKKLRTNQLQIKFTGTYKYYALFTRWSESYFKISSNWITRDGQVELNQRCFLWKFMNFSKLQYFKYFWVTASKRFDFPRTQSGPLILNLAFFALTNQNVQVSSVLCTKKPLLHKIFANRSLELRCSLKQLF